MISIGKKIAGRYPVWAFFVIISSHSLEDIIIRYYYYNIVNITILTILYIH